jgi:outer membrane protein OmpU
MKKTLLASTALVGAALLAAPASAGNVGAKDGMNVSLSGLTWFTTTIYDEDISANKGRGYKFSVNEAEVHIKASNTADNGISYGLTIELNAGSNDGTAADEVFVHIDSDEWGRLELGDQDDAADRMAMGSWQANKGTGGPYGGLGTQSMFSSRASAPLSNANWQVTTTSDATKATYFSPRFGGFQVGASLTPDSGQAAGAAGQDADNDGNIENIFSYGVNYSGKFDEIGVGLSFVGQSGDGESAIGADEAEEDLAIWSVGTKLDFAGFTLGAHYTDGGESGVTAANARNGAEQGSVWGVGLGYQAGPWGVSAWYTDYSADNANTSPAGATETELTRIGFGLGYAVAPGWKMTADVEIFSHDNISDGAGVGTTTDNDGRGFMLNNQFSF